MSVHAPSGPSRTVDTHDCGCGCGGRCGCENRCCELECLVRPNFFCGQLLTDADLGAVVEWTRRRLSLSRYRHGWGIACGLQVSCSPPHGDRRCCDPADGGPHVYVHPGYAVDCCGNDLVVCEPLPVDLSSVCRPEDDPCVPPPPGKVADNKGQKTPGKGGGRATGATDCWDRLGEGAFAVDLTLRYGEELSHGQRSLLGTCGDDARCQYARIIEQPCVRPTLVAEYTATQAGMDPHTEAYRKELKARREEVEAAIKRGGRGVREYLRKHPPSRLCFLEDLLCCLFEDERANPHKTDPALQERLLRWLIYDWVLSRTECECHSCRPDTGVPLARVYVRRTNGPQPTCQLVFIDLSQPHRRPLSRDDCWTAPDAIDLRRYYWQPRDAAMSDPLLAARLRQPQAASADGPLLDDLERSELFARPGDDLEPRIVVDPLGIERIVAFVKKP